MRIVFGASEVAEYVYCKRAWWLRRVQETPISDSSNLQYGTSVHLSHSRRVKHALGLQYCGYLLVVMGVIAAILLLLDVVPLR